VVDMIEIAELDPMDDRGLRAYYEVERSAMGSAFPHQVLRTYDALAMVREPQPYYRKVLLVARDGAGTIGTAEIGLSIGDNEHLADLEVHVAPDRQREGIGRRLFQEAAARCRTEGRGVAVGEANVADGTPDAEGPSYAFAVAMGATSVHQEVHLVLDLPVTPPAAGPPDGWEVLTWLNHCPDEYAAAYCAMRTQMENDVPRGDLDYEPFVFDEERLRVGEARIAKLYHQVVAVARRVADGAFGGYSIVFLPFGETHVLQDDTLVMPEHRGRRLGTRLKVATLEVVQRDHLERTALHTWTAPDNHAMQRTNRDLGYRPVDRMHEMQCVFGAADA
jgi:GNAT superfamily N-acetyltransferase